MQAINLYINGEDYPVLIESNNTLLEVMRDKLGLTGTKEGCNCGDCGTCTVLVDGQPVLACLTFAKRMEGREILTIEGLAQGKKLHPLQQAFVIRGSIQCGFCSPGMILTGKALLDYNPRPSREEIKKAIAGNLCRCTGYIKIFDAIEEASEKIAEEQNSQQTAGK
jgi:carbon-monoxide dehydrogenase small subunit